MKSYAKKLIGRQAMKPKLPSPWVAHQKTVPRMPVPELEATLARYETYLEPLLGDRDRAAVSRLVKAFGGSAEGAALQAELRALAQRVGGGWWIEGIWDHAYLAPRCPLVLNVNPFFVISEAAKGPAASRGDAVAQAGALAHAFAHVASGMRSGTLAPDMERTTPLCMKQYPKLFGCGRVALPGRDELHLYPNSRHMVVMVRGHMAAVEILREQDGRPHARATIEAALRAVQRQAPSGAATLAVGLFSTEDRDVWATQRHHLAAAHSDHRTYLELLDSALFVLNLDEGERHEPSEAGDERLARWMLHGDGTNRYFDKLQLTVLGDGTAAVNFEHAPFDGHTVLRLVHEARDFLRRPDLESQENEAPVTTVEPLWMTWRAQKGLVDAAALSAERFGAQVASLDMQPLRFREYGKSQIVQWKMSPDAVAQMAFQIATARTLGQQVSTYESAMTKRFDSGRTETLRSVTPESAVLVRTWAADSGASAADRIAALRSACEAHTRRMNEAKNGEGVDRHLYALSKLAAVRRSLLPEHEFTVPELFKHPSFSTLMTSVLSTSNCGSDALDLFGFGAVTPEGLGVGYFINNDSMTFTASSFGGSSRRHKVSKAHSFASHLEGVLLEFQHLLQ